MCHQLHTRLLVCGWPFLSLMNHCRQYCHVHSYLHLLELMPTREKRIAGLGAMDALTSTLCALRFQSFDQDKYSVFLQVPDTVLSRLNKARVPSLAEYPTGRALIRPRFLTHTIAVFLVNPASLSQIPLHRNSFFIRHPSS